MYIEQLHVHVYDWDLAYSDKLLIFPSVALYNVQ